MLEPKAGWTVKFTDEKPLLPLTVALKQRNTKHLKAFFEKVSNPRSSTYGKYKSLKEVNKMVAPSAAHVKKVTKYFKTAGFKIVGLSKSGDFLTVKATPAVINAALKTDIQLWHNKNTGGQIWRALTPYSFPAAIGSKIDFVSGVHHFPNPKKGVFLTPASTYAIGPTDLRTRYNVTDFASGNANNTQAVAEFQGQYYSPTDLETFFEKYVPGNKNATVAGVVGPNLGSDPGVEAELDIQYIMGVNPDTPTYFYSQQSFEFFSDLTNWITILNDDPSPPLVHSISYGEQKEHQTSSSYKSRFETEMQKLGSRGITIIFASGDSGVGCFLCYKFEPSFPATSPSVTSVGATTFLSGPPVTPQTTEGAVTAFGSGGGFSWTYDRPSYQEAAVNSYIQNHGGDIPSQIHWSKNGRGTPDVAALGWGFSVVVNGGVEQIGGTSAAAPTFR
jgi:tripeptidyl-peptidase-1